ncbi:MAG: hypothetical protein OEY07_20025, partial [Gammaproteobacteria bacterium]|nr:hypothetical protein [Gammaproteobacteria bacterium]
MKLINSSISRSRIFWVAIACLLPVFNLHAFNYGKIDASQGVACNACHSGGLAPSVSLTGPANVAPGSVNRFTIMVSGGQQNQGGFNVAVSDGTVRAVTAGSWVTNNQVHHYTPGIANANGVISWQFDWTAPATDSTVVIYAAGLSTDASGSQTGDA